MEGIKYTIEFPSYKCSVLLDELVHNFLVNSKRHYTDKKVSIYAPRYFIKFLKMEYASRMNNYPDGEIVRFRGYQLRESYDNKLVMAHIDYPLYKEQDMYSELNII